MATEIDFYNRPRVFNQTTSDVAGDSPQNARNIGDLQKDVSRLNLFGALTKNDLVDYFRFRVRGDGGATGMSYTADNSVRIELLERRSGRLLADSEATFGDRKANWDNLQKGRLELGGGEYLIRITRGTGLSREEKPNYSLQLMMGDTYKNDYETIDRPPPRNSTLANSGNSAIATILSSDANNLALNIFV